MNAVAQPTVRVHRIGIRVPDRRQAAEHAASVVGAGRVRHAGTTTLVDADPAVQLELIDANRPGPRDAPRVVDLGTQHLCWRVTDVDAAAEHLARQPGISVLGDVVEIPVDPLAGNRWIYYRSPWGTLFELQQWPTEPAYAAATGVRLDHTRHSVAGSVLPA